MKLFVFITCVSVAVLANELNEEQKQKLKTIHQECQSDPATKIDEHALGRQVRAKGDLSSIENIGPHSLCMNRKLGLQAENGDIDQAALRSRLSQVIKDETKLNEVISDCGSQKDTPEATAINLSRCLHEHVGSAVHHHHHHRHH